MIFDRNNQMKKESERDNELGFNMKNLLRDQKAQPYNRSKDSIIKKNIKYKGGFLNSSPSILSRII